MTDAHAEVLAVLRRISEALRNRRYDELESLFDPRVTILLPGLVRKVDGRDALVKSYRDFFDRATIDEIEEDAPAIDVWGNTALAYYHWTLKWTAGGKQESASGYEVFVFNRSREDGTWKAVLRTLSFDSPA